MKFLQINRLYDNWTLFKRAFGGYKKQIVLLTILGIAGGLLEGIGINALIPLFSFALGGSVEGADKITLLIQKAFETFGLSFSLKYLLVLIALLFVFRALVQVWFEYLRAYISSDYEKKTRKNLLSTILSAEWSYLIKQRMGYLESIVMVDVPIAGGLLRFISSLIMKLSGLLIYILVAINISFWITTITLGIGAVIFFVLRPFLWRVKKIAQERTKLNKSTANLISENIFGIKTIKAMMVSSDVEKKAVDFFDRLRKLTVKTSLLKSMSNVLIEPIGVIFIVILFAYTYKSGDFGFPQFIPIVYLIQKIFVYIQQIQATMHGINDGAPHLKSILDYQQRASSNKEANSGKQSFKFDEKLEFKNVNFSYLTESSKVLNNLEFSINKGEMVGLIGPSGAGKTTIVDLILRLLRPTNGSILLDSIPIEGVSLSEWRKNIGYVSQDIFLMNDTVRNNISFYDSEITDEMIIESARMAHVDDVIRDAPKGLDTVIGDRGIRLSAGQRQRIVIARVLARKPKILILDEATSALDNESELKVQKVIEGLKGQVTVLAIAHRLTTVEDSDKLLVLEGGQINEQGSPSELLKDKKSYFSKAYNLRK